MEIIKLPIYLTVKMRPKENINEDLLKRFRYIMILHFMNIIMVKSVKYVKYQITVSLTFAPGKCLALCLARMIASIIHICYQS